MVNKYDEPMPSILADWMYKQRRDLSFREIAGEIQDIREGSGSPLIDRKITVGELTRIMSQTRMFMERNHRNTLWNLKGWGYRVATREELALYTAKSIRRTIVTAERTTRLVDIVDRKLIPGALRYVFPDAEQRVRQLGSKGQNFSRRLIEYIREKRDEKEKANV